MKLLLITLDTKGGMVHYTSQLANSLVKKNEVYVIAPKGIETELFSNSLHLIQLHMGNVKENFLLNLLLVNRGISFLRTIYKINPDIIHLQSYHLWLCLFLPFLQKYSIVTTIHDVNPHLGSRAIDQNISRKIHVKFSDLLFVHGQNAKEVLEKETKCKIFAIPHGDYSFFTKLKTYDYDEEPYTVLFFGRIAEYKGLTYLIKAAPLIISKIPNINIIIAGSGYFREKNEIEASPNFEVHNYFIDDEDVGKYFQRSSVVILPYIECTQTGVIPIAYAFKKPVIVTNVGSIPEIVDDGITGYIVPPKNSNSLAEAVIKLIRDENLRKKMGENAYEKMKNELSWDAIAEKTVKVYRDVLEAKNEAY